MSINSKHLGIAERRVRLGLSQKELGQVAGCDQSRVSRAENSPKSPDAQRLITALDTLEETAARNSEQWEAFWSATENADIPHRMALVEHIGRIAHALMDGSLSDVRLGMQLAACLPRSVRDSLLD